MELILNNATNKNNQKLEKSTNQKHIQIQFPFYNQQASSSWKNIHNNMVNIIYATKDSYPSLQYQSNLASKASCLKKITYPMGISTYHQNQNQTRNQFTNRYYATHQQNYVNQRKSSDIQLLRKKLQSSFFKETKNNFRSSYSSQDSRIKNLISSNCKKTYKNSFKAQQLVQMINIRQFKNLVDSNNKINQKQKKQKIKIEHKEHDLRKLQNNQNQRKQNQFTEYLSNIRQQKKQNSKVSNFNQLMKTKQNKNQHESIFNIRKKAKSLEKQYDSNTPAYKIKKKEFQNDKVNLPSVSIKKQQQNKIIKYKQNHLPSKLQPKLGWKRSKDKKCFSNYEYYKKQKIQDSIRLDVRQYQKLKIQSVYQNNKENLNQRQKNSYYSRASLCIHQAINMSHVLSNSSKNKSNIFLAKLQENKNLKINQKIINGSIYKQEKTRLKIYRN